MINKNVIRNKMVLCMVVAAGTVFTRALAMLFFSYKTKKKFWLIVPLLVIYMLSIRLVSDRLIKSWEQEECIR